MSVKMRQEVERKIATAFVTSAIQDGYAITVDYGDGPSKKLTSIKSVLAAMFQGDEDRLFLYLPHHPVHAGWVLFIYGNDGWDVISDYTTNLDHIMSEANKISDYYAD